MPSFIKTPEQEKKWEEAKQAAHKSYGPKEDTRYWATVNHIYQNMTKVQKADPIGKHWEPPKSNLPYWSGAERNANLPIDQRVDSTSAPKGSTSQPQPATIKVSPETLKKIKVKKGMEDYDYRKIIDDYLEQNPQLKAMHKQLPPDIRDHIIFGMIKDEGRNVQKAEYWDTVPKTPVSPNNEKLGVYLANEMSRIQTWIAWLVASGVPEEDATAMAYRFSTVPGMMNPGYITTQYIFEDATRRAKNIPFLHKSFLPSLFENIEIRKSYGENKKKLVEKLKKKGNHPEVAEKIANSIGKKNKIKKALFSKSQEKLIDKYDLDPDSLDYARPGDSIKTIGKSKKDGKWYGWSHRAIFGFKSGDIIDEKSCMAGETGANGHVYKTGDKCKSEKEAKQWAKDFADFVG